MKKNFLPEFLHYWQSGSTTNTCQYWKTYSQYNQYWVNPISGKYCINRKEFCMKYQYWLILALLWRYLQWNAIITKTLILHWKYFATKSKYYSNFTFILKILKMKCGKMFLLILL